MSKLNKTAFIVEGSREKDILTKCAPGSGICIKCMKMNQNKHGIKN